MLRRLIGLIILFSFSACTSFDDTPTPEEAANQAAEASFESAGGDLSFSAQGGYVFRGIPLEETGKVNGQPSFADIDIAGTTYQVIASQFRYGTSVYAVSASEQFAEIGSDQTPVADINSITIANYAGKYAQREIDAGGIISEETSANILLELNLNTGSLTARTGPNVEYAWDAGAGQFAGVNGTDGAAIAYEDQTLLGHYHLADPQKDTFGTFFARGFAGGEDE